MRHQHENNHTLLLSSPESIFFTCRNVEGDRDDKRTKDDDDDNNNEKKKKKKNNNSESKRISIDERTREREGNSLMSSWL